MKRKTIGPGIVALEDFIADAGGLLTQGKARPSATARAGNGPSAAVTSLNRDFPETSMTGATRKRGGSDRLSKLLAVWAAVAGLMLTATAVAHLRGMRSLRAYNNNLSLAFTQSHVEYGERLSPPNGTYFDTESGFIKGGRVAVSGMRNDGIRNLYFHVSYQQTNGNLTYVGGINGTNTSLIQPHNAHMTDIGLRLGQGFMVAHQMMLVPYIGYGFHHWGRGEPAGLTTPSDYYESYRNQYAAFGVLWQTEIFHRLITTLNLAYGRTIQPTISAPAFGFAEGLGPKPWKRAGLAIDYLIGRHEAVFMSATFTEFQYGAGSVIVASSGLVGSEPFSQTEITNYDFGARFLF